MKKGDLVTVAGTFYDAPINHHDPVLAIRHHGGLLRDRQLGMIVDTAQVFYSDADYVPGNAAVWYRVLTGEQTAWFGPGCVRSVDMNGSDPCV